MVTDRVEDSQVLWTGSDRYMALEGIQLTSLLHSENIQYTLFAICDVNCVDAVRADRLALCLETVVFKLLMKKM